MDVEDPVTWLVPDTELLMDAVAVLVNVRDIDADRVPEDEITDVDGVAETVLLVEAVHVGVTVQEGVIPAVGDRDGVGNLVPVRVTEGETDGVLVTSPVPDPETDAVPEIVCDPVPV